MNSINLLKQALEECRQKIDLLISKAIPTLGPPSKLRDACEYALLNGGKRFRPALVMLVAQALKAEADLSCAALAIEYFHTASLIADDLPCMDDDSQRRNKPSLHVAFGEATALMASYALISAGYGLLAKNAEQIERSKLPHAKEADLICRLAIENVSFNTGLEGATGGQFMDIHPPDNRFETFYEIIRKKTTSLFEISFVLGWLYGGGEKDKLDLVKKAAFHFGQAFQIADDLGDIQQDLQNGRAVNIAFALGEDGAKKRLDQEVLLYQEALKELGIASPELLALSLLMPG